MFTKTANGAAINTPKIKAGYALHGTLFSWYCQIDGKQLNRGQVATVRQAETAIIQLIAKRGEAEATARRKAKC